MRLGATIAARDHHRVLRLPRVKKVARTVLTQLPGRSGTHSYMIDINAQQQQSDSYMLD